MRFAITGASGFLGTALREFLLARGHEVTRVVRSLAGVAPGEKVVVWHPEHGAIETAGLEGHDVVVHYAGASLFGVWTPARKREILESRVKGTTLLSKTLAGLEQKPRVLFSASGVNAYGDRPPDEVVTEESERGTGFLADVVRAWEESTKPAEDAGIRVVHMRNGIVLHPSGGMLQPILPLFKLGLGGQLGSGKQAFSWIARDDVPPAIMHLIEHEEVSGPVNFTAPQPVTNAEFTRALAAAVQRPAIFKVPAFAARLAPGGMADEILLFGARVIPKKLMDSGYTFRWPELRPALKAMLA